MGMLPLAPPIRSEALLFDLIPQVLNITDRTSMLLLVAWWIVSLRGRGPFLVLVIRGGSGTAKSNALLVIRGVLDPNGAMKNHLSKDQRDLVISVANCYVASFDNVSYLPEDIADAICVLATGGGLRTRKLHTDAEETIFNKTAPVVVNGIPDILGRPDLAARAVVVELEAIPDDQRKTEAALEVTKQQVLPPILGRLLDVMVGVLQQEPMTKPTVLPRMADAAVTLTAAEMALRVEPGTYIALLNRQANDAADAVLEDQAALVTVLLQLTEQATKDWEGELKELMRVTPSDLHTQKPWTAKRLGNALRRLNDVLPRAGLRVVPPVGLRKDGPSRDKRVWRVELANGTRGTRLLSSPISREEEEGRSRVATMQDVSHVSQVEEDLPF
jgi:hypothetical protein